MGLLIVLVVLAGAQLAPGLLIGPPRDAAVFSHVGSRLLDGVAPYLGTWDHKPPGIYLASAAVHAVLGWVGPWTADWLLSLGATVGLGLAVAAVLARLGVSGWPRSLAAVGATILASNYLLAVGGGLTEPPAALYAALALALAVGPISFVRLGAIGALIGLSIIFSVQLVPGGLVVVALSLVRGAAPRRTSRAAVMALGLSAPLAVVVVWLAMIGALPGAIDALVTYSAAYRASSGAYGSALAAPIVGWTLLVSLFLVAPVLLGAASMTRASPGRGVAVASLLWVAGSLVLFAAQGRFYAHYAIPLAIPLGILAGLGLQRVGELLQGVGRSTRRVVILLPLVVMLAVSVVAGVISTAMQIAAVADPSVRAHAVAERLRQLPAGPLLVWGNEPRLYDLTGRLPATRYSYLYPLTTPGYSTAGMIEEVIQGLEANPPAVVVDAGSRAPGKPGFLPLLIDRRLATDGRDLDLLDPLRAFVADRYELDGIVAGWPIYVRRGESTS